MLLLKSLAEYVTIYFFFNSCYTQSESAGCVPLSSELSVPMALKIDHHAAGPGRTFSSWGTRAPLRAARAGDIKFRSVFKASRRTAVPLHLEARYRAPSFTDWSESRSTSSTTISLPTWSYLFHPQYLLSLGQDIGSPSRPYLPERHHLRISSNFAETCRSTTPQTLSSPKATDDS